MARLNVYFFLDVISICVRVASRYRWMISLMLWKSLSKLAASSFLTNWMMRNIWTSFKWGNLLSEKFWDHCPSSFALQYFVSATHREIDSSILVKFTELDCTEHFRLFLSQPKFLLVQNPKVFFQLNHRPSHLTANENIILCVFLVDWFLDNKCIDLHLQICFDFLN